MDSDRLLAFGIGIGGFLVVVYATTELAGLFFGIDWMPQSLIQIGQLDRAGPTVNRMGRAVPLLLLLAVDVFVIALALGWHRQEFDVLDQLLFAGQFVASILWIGWLWRLHSKRTQRG